MKYLNFLKRIAPVFICTIGLTTMVEAQNAAQLIQVDKEKRPIITVQRIKSTIGDQRGVKSNSIQYISMEKSDKMVMVNTEISDSISRAVPLEKTRVVRKLKSDKIDQK